MSDDDIRAAYDRLGEASAGHPSLGAGLAGRVRRRRRRRAALVVAGTVVLVAGAGGVVAAVTSGDDDRTAPVAADPTAPPTTTMPLPTAGSLELVCATGEQSSLIVDFESPITDGDPAAVIAEGAARGDRYVVAGSGIWLLRADGTAYERDQLDGSRRTGYRISGNDACGDENAGNRRTDVTLDIGHCWIEPLDVLGRTWSPLGDEQVGYGGPMPQGLSGTGDVRWWSADHDRLEYVDAEGARLDLYPTTDPRTDLRGACR